MPVCLNHNSQVSFGFSLDVKAGCNFPDFWPVSFKITTFWPLRSKHNVRSLCDDQLVGKRLKNGSIKQLSVTSVDDKSASVIWV